jgi:hypothetical protein
MMRIVKEGDKRPQANKTNLLREIVSYKEKNIIGMKKLKKNYVFLN